MACCRKFTPISKEWQNETCEKLGISYTDNDMFSESTSHLGDPSMCFKVKGDGKCSFRSIAFAVCGKEELHMYFRNINYIIYCKSNY
jgi:hypothetical protein